MQILVFGDSIVYGAWDTEGGWVSRLRQYLDAKILPDFDSYYLIYNLGISGNTAEDLLHRFEDEAKSRISEDEVVVMFAIGINDSQFLHSQNSQWYSPEQFRNNILKLIEVAGVLADKIIFVGLTPVDEAKMDPNPWNAEKSYRNEYIQQNNEVIKSICRDSGLGFIEVMNEFLKVDYKKLLEDGLHPNADGHKKIFEIVRDYLVKEKIV